MKTIFYKIIDKDDNVVYIGVTTRTINQRFKEHIINKCLNPTVYSIVEIDELIHPCINSLEQFYEERVKVATLEQKYIQEYKGKGCQLLNISNGGEWGTQILNKLCKGKFFEIYGTYDGYEEQYNKYTKIKKWFRNWMINRTNSHFKLWLNHWLEHKTNNKCKQWLNNWKYSKTTNVLKKWLRHWLNHHSIQPFKYWLYNWKKNKSVSKCKKWLTNWKNHRTNNRCKCWIYHWINHKNENKCKSWLNNWKHHRCKNRTKYWLSIWKNYKSRHIYD